MFGVFMMGVIVARWVTVDFASVRGLFGSSTISQFVDTMINGGLNVIAPVALTLVCVWLIRRRISPIWIILGLFVIGVLGYYAGVLV